MTRKNKGVLLGMLGTCSYGTNPLFALPLYAAGMDVNSVLFYRYLGAVILYGLWVSCYKKVCVNKRHKTYAFRRTNFIFQTVDRPINYDYLGVIV